MAQETRTQLKTYFETNDIPTQAQFINLIDSILNFQDDGNPFDMDNMIEGSTGLVLTQAERTKIGNLEENYKGYYATVSAFVTAHPTGVYGDWAIVGTGASTAVYIWNGTSWIASPSAGDVTATAGNFNANSIPVGNGGGNKDLKNTPVTIDNSGNIAGVGDITTSGNVNGRDMSADGVFVDGLQAQAGDSLVTALQLSLINNFKGYFSDFTALTTAHPTGAAADWAVVQGLGTHYYNTNTSSWSLSSGTVSDSQIVTGYNNQVAVVSQVDAEAGTSTDTFRWTPERVSQAIAALGNVGDMTKSVYDPNDDGVVASADKIETIDAAANSTYYGKDVSGNPGFHALPSSSGFSTSTSASNTVSFVDAHTYHRAASDVGLTGNITLTLTVGRGGHTAVIKHNDSSVPSFSGATIEWQSDLNANYQTGSDNLIFLQQEDGDSSPYVIGSIMLTSSPGGGFTRGTSTSSTITFADNFTEHIGSGGTPLTGNLTVTLTSGRGGNQAVVSHNDSAAPTVTGISAEDQAYLSAHYVPGALNQLWFMQLDNGAGSESVVFSMKPIAGVTTYDVIPLESRDFVSRTTAGATWAPATTLGTGTEEKTYGTFNFSSSSEQGAIVAFDLPQDYNGGALRAKVKWESNAGTTADTINWGIKGVALRDSFNIATEVWGTEVTISDSVEAVGDLHETQASGDITFSNSPSAGDRVFVEVVLKTSSVSDAKLHSVLLQYEKSEIAKIQWGADTTPPGAATSLAGSNVDSEGADLTWTSPGDPDINFYRIYVDGALHQTGTSATSHHLTGLSASTAYAVTVRAVDTSGNEGADSNTYNLTTAAGASNIMDTFTHTAHGAYSLEFKLYAAATSAFRLREDGGDTQVDIGFVGDRIDTAAITSHLGGNNGFIVTLYDQSTAGLDITQSDTTKQPALVLDAGEYGMDLDGVNDFLQSTANTLHSQAVQYFIVADEEETGAVASRLISGKNATNRHVIDGTTNPGAFSVYCGGTTMSSGATYKTHARSQLTFNVDEASSYIRKDGTQIVAAGATVGAVDNEGLTVGSNYVGTSSFYNGKIFEIIFIAATSDTNRDAVEADQATRFI